MISPQALKTFTSISQNIVYADKKGNIGLYCAAGVPIRKRDIAFGILPGQTDEYDWKGYVPFDQLPHLFNPAQGFVASANNRTTSADYPYHIGSWYSLPSRYERITEMLEDKKILSVDDFKAIQNDQHSRLAEKYMPAILRSLEAHTGWNDTEKKALMLLKNWDYSMDKKSVAAAIFETLYLQLIKCTFADELGPRFADFNGVTSISRNAMDQLMDIKDSPWFDDITTPDKKETINEAIVCSFQSEQCLILGNKWEQIRSHGNGERSIILSWPIRLHQLRSSTGSLTSTGDPFRWEAAFTRFHPIVMTPISRLNPIMVPRTGISLMWPTGTIHLL